MLASDFLSVGLVSMGSRLNSLVSISLTFSSTPILVEIVFSHISGKHSCKYIPNILFNTNFGQEIVFSHIFGVSLFQSYAVAAYSLPTSGTIRRGNNTPSQHCFDCIRSVIVIENNISGFQCYLAICPYQESNRYVVIFIDLVLDSFKMSPLF